MKFNILTKKERKRYDKFNQGIKSFWKKINTDS